VALWIARPLSLLVLVMQPVLVLIRWINRPLERTRAGAEAGDTVEEITALAGLARLSKHISRHQERIIKGAIRLARLTARDVMIPVEHIGFLSTCRSVSDALAAAQIEAHTRSPVIEDDDVNRVIGYVNFKELVYEMRTKGDDASLRGILRPLHYCGPDDLATDLVRVFVEQRIHMAIVRDSQQNTLGLITLEDLVEELVGEIEDEFDRLPRQAYPLRENIWLFGGGVPVSRVNALTGATLPDEGLLLSAWMTARLERTPRSGDSVREGPIRLTIRRIRRGRIYEVLLETR
jgi:putative hemolysin